MTAAAACY